MSGGSCMSKETEKGEKIQNGALKRLKFKDMLVYGSASIGMGFFMHSIISVFLSSIKPTILQATL